MPIDEAQARETIQEFLKSKKKTKFYFNDFTKLFPDAKQREVKKILTGMVKDQILEYWSSGSTTLYGLVGAGKQAASEGEE